MRDYIEDLIFALTYCKEREDQGVNKNQIKFGELSEDEIKFLVYLQIKQSNRFETLTQEEFNKFTTEDDIRILNLISTSEINAVVPANIQEMVREFDTYVKEEKHHIQTSNHKNLARLIKTSVQDVQIQEVITSEILPEVIPTSPLSAEKSKVLREKAQKNTQAWIENVEAVLKKRGADENESKRIATQYVRDYVARSKPEERISPINIQNVKTGSSLPKVLGGAEIKPVILTSKSEGDEIIRRAHRDPNQLENNVAVVLEQRIKGETGKELNQEQQKSIRQIAREYTQAVQELKVGDKMPDVSLDKVEELITSGNVQISKPESKTIKLVPVGNVKNIKLTPLEATTVITNAEHANSNPTAYTNATVVEVEKVLKNDPDASKVLNATEIHNVALNIAPDVTQRFLNIHQQIGNLPKEEQIEKVAEIVPPISSVNIIEPFTNPYSPAYRTLNKKDSEVIAEKARAVQIPTAIMEDLTRKYWVRTFGAETSNAFLGNPNIHYQVNEEPNNNEGINVDIKTISDAYGIYSNFFGGVEVAVTSEATSIIPAYSWYLPSSAGLITVESAVVPIAGSAVTTYLGWQTTNNILLYYSANSLAMPSIALLGGGFAELPAGIGAAGVAADFAPVLGNFGTITVNGITKPIVGFISGEGVEMLGVTAAAEATTTALAVGGTGLAVAGEATAAAAIKTVATRTLGSTVTAVAGFLGTPLGALVSAASIWVAGKVLPAIKKYIVPIFAGLGAVTLFIPFGIGGAAIGAAIGAALAGGVTGGSFAAGVATISGAVAALGGAFVSALAIPFTIALIGIPVLIALIMFIINSSAYVVPGGISFSGGGTAVNINVPCDASKVPGSPAEAAVCIVNDLIQFNLNPLDRSMFTSSAWTSFAASLPPLVVKPIHDVTQNNVTLQCTALVAASGNYAYNQNILLNFPRACDYLSHPFSGYTAVHGTAGIAAGDFFIIDGTPNCGAGTGHIGVVESVDGALISCADANYIGPGKVRVAHGCFALTQILGYLRKQ